MVHESTTGQFLFEMCAFSFVKTPKASMALRNCRADLSLLVGKHRGCGSCAIVCLPPPAVLQVAAECQLLVAVPAAFQAHAPTCSRAMQCVQGSRLCIGGGRNLWGFQSFGPPHSWRTAADGNKAHFKFKVGYLFNLFFVGNFFHPPAKSAKIHLG